jgi:hypothetical protein
MAAAEAVKLKRAAGDLVEAENKQIALWSESITTGAIKRRSCEISKICYLYAAYTLVDLNSSALKY